MTEAELNSEAIVVINTATGELMYLLSDDTKLHNLEKHWWTKLGKFLHVL